jgi:hypothetical protein
MEMNDALMMELLQEVRAISEHVKNYSANINDSIWIDNVELQEYLHISTKTIQRLRESGMLKYSKVRGKLFYRRSDVHAMLEQNLITTKLQ